MNRNRRSSLCAGPVHGQGEPNLANAEMSKDCYVEGVASGSLAAPASRLTWSVP